MTETIDLPEIKKNLLLQKQTLLERITAQSNQDNEAANPDRADLAWQYNQDQRGTMLLARAREQLDEVEQALERIKQGTYGQCTQCGQAIHPERLKAMPTAALCIPCQQEE
ncbi:MAG: TraR/DksA C4-type zinc finger protein [Anaerolineales bacterium]|nr:TraR/DksA C4-type zinc finger protein [Anaerolineales bacterium]